MQPSRSFEETADRLNDLLARDRQKRQADLDALSLHIAQGWLVVSNEEPEGAVAEANPAPVASRDRSSPPPVPEEPTDYLPPVNAPRSGQWGPAMREKFRQIALEKDSGW